MDSSDNSFSMDQLLDQIPPAGAVSRSESEDADPDSDSDGEGELDPTTHRSVQVAPARPDVLSSGLPFDGDLVQSQTSVSIADSKEFDPTRPFIQRSLAVEKPMHDNPAESLSNRGVAFDAASALSSAAEGSASHQLAALTLPFYLKPSKNSFRSSAPLAMLTADFERAFSELSVHWELKPACAKYECSALHLNSRVEFNVQIFRTTKAQEHLVDIQHLQGCRFSFIQCMDGIARESKYWTSKPKQSKLLAPPLSVPEVDVQPESRKRDRDFITSMMTSSSRDSNMQGFRAAATWSSNSDVLAMIVSGGHLTRMASEISKALASEGANQLAAISTVANLAAQPDVQNDAIAQAWLAEQAPAVIEVIKDDDESGHVYRESIRALGALGKLPGVPSLVVKSGLIPILSSEAAGEVNEGACRDVQTQKFAEIALVSCR